MTSQRQQLATSLAVLAALERLRTADGAGSLDGLVGGAGPADADGFCDLVFAQLLAEFHASGVSADASSVTVVGAVRESSSGVSDPVDVVVILPAECAAWWQRRSGLALVGDPGVGDEDPDDPDWDEDLHGDNEEGDTHE